MNTTPPAKPQKPRYILWAVIALLLVALLWRLHTHSSFNWHTLAVQLRAVSLWYVLGAIALIYFSFWMRSVRWAILLGSGQTARPIELLAPQFIGFTAVALVGRIADLSRPYLIARQLRLPVASQLAVYSIERAFDLGAAAILFSLTLAFAPANLPHHEAYVHAGVVSLAATLGIAIFAISLRVAGEAVARLLQAMLSPLSKSFAEKLVERVLDFRDGLRTVSTMREFFGALATSLVIWVSIAACYVLTARSFVAEPTLHQLSVTAVMLVLATSMGGSLLQLPVLGWFTQIGLIAFAFHGFFSVPGEAATACSALLLFNTTLSIVPAGLIAARIRGTSLRDAVKESGAVQQASEA